MTDYGFFGNFQIGDGNYSAAADLNRDGLLTSQDSGQWICWYQRAALPVGRVSDNGTSGFTSARYHPYRRRDGRNKDGGLRTDCEVCQSGQLAFSQERLC